MNEFGKESLDIKGLEFKDLSRNYDVKELGVKEIANGAGISEVGAVTVGEKVKTHVLATTLSIVFGSVLFIVVGIVAAIYLVIRWKNSTKKIKTSETPPIPEKSNPNAKEVTELTTVVANLDDCTKKISALKTAAILCDQELKDPDQRKQILFIQATLDTIMDGFNDVGKNLKDADEKNLKSALADVERRLKALDKLKQETVNKKKLNDLSRADEEFKKSVKTLNNSLMEAGIIAQDGNYNNLNFDKYTALKDNELEVLIKKLDAGKPSFAEIHDIIQEGAVISFNTPREVIKINIQETSGNLSTKLNGFSDKINANRANVVELQETILNKLAAVEREKTTDLQNQPSTEQQVSKNTPFLPASIPHDPVKKNT